MNNKGDEFLDRLFGGDGDEAHAPSPPAKPKKARIQPLGKPPSELEPLLDFIFERFQTDAAFEELASVVEPLRGFNRAQVARAIDRRIGNPPDSEAEGLSLRIFMEMGPLTASLLKHQWETARLDTDEQIFCMPRLAKESIPVIGASRTVESVLQALDRLNWPAARPDAPAPYFALPFAFRYALVDSVQSELLLKFVLKLMDRLPPAKLAGNVLHALTPFEDERVLDWMESHAAEPITYEWGTAAAVSKITWERITRWLDRGRPLSLIALDAMKNCRGFDAKDPEMSGVFKVVAPKILRPASQKKMRKRLEKYLQKDGDPNVKRKVAVIIDHLPQLVEPK